MRSRLLSAFGAFAKRVGRSEDGVAATEVALAAPVLLLLLLGGYDVGRYVLIHKKVAQVGFAVSDVTSQYTALTKDAMTLVFMTTGQILPGYVSGSTGVTIVTSVYLSGTQPKVSWQCYSTATSAWTSKIGVAGGNAAISAALLSDTKDNLIIAEVYYKFSPIFSTFFKSSSDIYSQSLFRPRLGALTTKPC
ncbi:TadE/TadG family type IV pilus assembly protein [Methylopila sp. 73B]|uniref:TadE/TadG family type IV pilus assembly protein n=1 Tax=Methylopila sp. 73B TaxID=1120792 RepID=UPI0003643B8D|nr:TadE/TadG family type IV pilus assembly protein [Methylopila sp. 73B]